MNCNVVNPNLVVAKSFVRHFPVQVLTAQSSRFDMVEPFLKRHGLMFTGLTRIRPFLTSTLLT